jgi:hypothetical protein
MNWRFLPLCAAASSEQQHHGYPVSTASDHVGQLTCFSPSGDAQSNAFIYVFSPVLRQRQAH